jgi:protein TonB
MSVAIASRRDRVIAGSGALLVEALIGLLLFMGIQTHLSHGMDEPLKLIHLVQVPPQPKVKVVPVHLAGRKPEGEASAPNRKSKATEIVAPAQPVAKSPPVMAARRHALDLQPTAGAAAVIGPGTGSGGIGNGTGNGGSGLGGGGRARDSELIKGSIEDSDIPRSARRRGFQGSVTARYVVTPDGRATQCGIIRSSGDADVDSMVCHLIEKRYRFTPALDAAGRPIASVEEDVHDFTRGEVSIDDPDEPER